MQAELQRVVSTPSTKALPKGWSHWRSLSYVLTRFASRTGFVVKTQYSKKPAGVIISLKFSSQLEKL
jgi:hypothetical protein